MKNPDASIIICSAGRPLSLEKTVKAVASGRYHFSGPDGLTDCEVEILVVDNTSDGQNRAVVQRCKGFNHVRYLHQSVRGKANAFNAGLCAAKGEIIVSIDDDILPQPMWFTRLTEPIRRGNSDAVQGAVIIAAECERRWMKDHHRHAFAMLREVNETQRSNPFLAGANMAFHRRVLDKVPAFDRELGPGLLGFAEDSLFGAQLLEAGFSIVFEMDAVVHHHFPQERLVRREFLKCARGWGRSSAYMTHHWGHEKYAYPRLRMLLNGWRWFRSARQSRIRMDEEGISDSEAEFAFRYWLYRSFLTESKRPRNYLKRGLVRCRP